MHAAALVQPSMKSFRAALIGCMASQWLLISNIRRHHFSCIFSTVAITADWVAFLTAYYPIRWQIVHFLLSGLDRLTF
jgi:hypothetical protein